MTKPRKRRIALRFIAALVGVIVALHIIPVKPHEPLWYHDRDEPFKGPIRQEYADSISGSLWREQLLHLRAGNEIILPIVSIQLWMEIMGMPAFGSDFFVNHTWRAVGGITYGYDCNDSRLTPPEPAAKTIMDNPFFTPSIIVVLKDGVVIEKQPEVTSITMQRLKERHRAAIIQV